MAQRLNAEMKKDENGKTILNEYDCRECLKAKIPHQVIDVPGLSTDRSSYWGPGLPTTMRHCTNCQAEDGPWVSAELVGGGY